MHLTVAEYATVNPDGTFSVIRGGIDQWKTKTIPFDFAASLLIEVPSGRLDPGFFPMHISARDGVGNLVFELSGVGSISKPEGILRAAIHFGGKIASLGALRIETTVGVETGQQVVNVVLDTGERDGHGD